MHDSYLILLRKAKAVIGLQSLYVIRQVGNSDGWVLPHSWDKKKTRQGTEKRVRICFSLYVTFTQMNTNTGWTTGWVKLPVGPWGGCVTVKESALPSIMHGERGEKRERGGERDCVRWDKPVRFGDIVMLSEENRGGAGSAMHMSGWVSMLQKEAGGRHLWPHNAQQGSGDGMRAGTYTFLQISRTVTSQRVKKKNWLITSPN